MTTEMTETITIPKGSYGMRIDFIVRNDDGTPYNLLGLTIAIKAWTKGAPGALFFTGACVISGATSGMCYYIPIITDFATVGQYVWELEMTKAGFIDNTLPGIMFVTESG